MYAQPQAEVNAAVAEAKTRATGEVPPAPFRETLALASVASPGLQLLPTQTTAAAQLLLSHAILAGLAVSKLVPQAVPGPTGYPAPAGSPPGLHRRRLPDRLPGAPTLDGGSAVQSTSGTACTGELRERLLDVAISIAFPSPTVASVQLPNTALVCSAGTLFAQFVGQGPGGSPASGEPGLEACPAGGPPGVPLSEELVRMQAGHQLLATAHAFRSLSRDQIWPLVSAYAQVRSPWRPKHPAPVTSCAQCGPLGGLKKSAACLALVCTNGPLGGRKKSGAWKRVGALWSLGRPGGSGLAARWWGLCLGNSKREVHGGGVWVPAFEHVPSLPFFLPPPLFSSPSSLAPDPSTSAAVTWSCHVVQLLRGASLSPFLPPSSLKSLFESKPFQHQSAHVPSKCQALCYSFGEK